MQTSRTFPELASNQIRGPKMKKMPMPKMPPKMPKPGKMPMAKPGDCASGKGW